MYNGRIKGVQNIAIVFCSCLNECSDTFLFYSTDFKAWGPSKGRSEDFCVSFHLMLCCLAFCVSKRISVSVEHLTLQSASSRLNLHFSLCSSFLKQALQHLFQQLKLPEHLQRWFSWAISCLMWGHKHQSHSRDLLEPGVTARLKSTAREQGWPWVTPAFEQNTILKPCFLLLHWFPFIYLFF